MGVLIPVEIDANYDTDREMVGKLNQHLEVFFNSKTDRVSFNLDIGEDDHFIMVSIKLGNLLEAIGKAKQIPEE